MDQSAATRGSTLERFRSYLYVLARAHLGPQIQQKVDASDLVQQTLLVAHQKRGQFRGATEAQRAAWLRQILANNLADALRHHARARRDARREQSLEAGIDQSFLRAEHWLAASVPSPSQRLIREEDLLRLSDAITSLPDGQQQAVILHHLQGLRLVQVASTMGRTEPAVAGLLYRGIRRLNELLDERA